MQVINQSYSVSPMFQAYKKVKKPVPTEYGSTNEYCKALQKRATVCFNLENRTKRYAGRMVKGSPRHLEMLDTAKGYRLQGMMLLEQADALIGKNFKEVIAEHVKIVGNFVQKQLPRKV